MRIPHILLLNQYFPPDTSATAKIADTVVEALTQRYQVTVLAGRPSYDPTERHAPYLLRREVQGNLVVERVGSTTFHRRRMSRRLSNYLSYLALAIPRAMSLRADVILAMTDPPVAGIAGAIVAKMRRLPFIYNIRDLYPDMALGGNIVQPAPWVEKWERLHCWALRQADRVIVLGDDMRQRIMAKGVNPDRVVVVRDGAPVSELSERVAASEPDHPVIKEVRCGFDFVVLHAGNIGFYGAWETLLKAARMLEPDGVGLVFVGDGSERRRLESLVNGCSAVRFLPFKPASQVPYVLAAGDLHVVTIRRGLEGVVVPSKLYGVLAAGRPVLAVASENSDVARIVRQVGCGFVANPDDPQSVVASIREALAAQARLQLQTMAERARAAAYKFDRNRELCHFIQVVDEVANTRLGEHKVRPYK